MNVAMKLTLTLLATLMACGIGFYVGASQEKRNCEEILFCEAVVGKVDGIVSMAYSWKNNIPKTDTCTAGFVNEFDLSVDFQLILCIYRIYLMHDRIPESDLWEAEEWLEPAKETLQLLNCASPEEFREKVRTVMMPSIAVENDASDVDLVSGFPEFFQPESVEFKRFDMFLSGIIEKMDEDVQKMGTSNL